LTAVSFHTTAFLFSIFLCRFRVEFSNISEWFFFFGPKTNTAYLFEPWLIIHCKQSKNTMIINKTNTVGPIFHSRNQTKYCVEDIFYSRIFFSWYRSWISLNLRDSNNNHRKTPHINQEIWNEGVKTSKAFRWYQVKYTWKSTFYFRRPYFYTSDIRTARSIIHLDKVNAIPVPCGTKIEETNFP
jgi:hypothetical protein